MSLFDRHIMVDWSGGNDTGPTPKADAIWLSEEGKKAKYFRNRDLVVEFLQKEIAACLKSGKRVMIGFDFPFGYPRGFTEALTGSDDPLALWEWFGSRVEDNPKNNNRFDLAGQINNQLGGIGPFWGNGLKRDIEDLPRLGRSRTFAGIPEKRVVETIATGSFTCWQLAGVGSVGSQAIMGIAALQRLRQQFEKNIAVWPFENLEKPVAFVEVWPSLIATEIAATSRKGSIKDAVQVETLSRAIVGLDAEGKLETLLGSTDDDHGEGWILGAGEEDILRRAARPLLSAPKLSNDCFALPQGVDWTPVDEALNTLRSRLKPVVAAEKVSHLEAAGRVLAKDVKARRSHPAAANCAVDGYGFDRRELTGEEIVLPLATGRAAAGQPFKGKLPQGMALRIMTGAILPKGVDTVVLEEDCTVTDTHIAFKNDLKPGANTRKAGEDVEKGDIAIVKSRVLTPPDCALSAALAVPELSVYQRLRVGVLSTGDELMTPDAKLKPHHTVDANRPMLLQMMKKWGFDAIDLGNVNDNRSALRNRLNQGALTCEAIITTGGASAGEEDHVSALLNETGSVDTWRIALKPGRPLALGMWNRVPIFGMPGNPVAVFVCSVIFARPALSVLAGAGWTQPVTFQVPAAFSKKKKPGRREFLRARLNSDGAVETFASEGSGRISGLSWAEGLVELPDGEIQIQPGDLVTYLPFSSFGL